MAITLRNGLFCPLCSAWIYSQDIYIYIYIDGRKGHSLIYAFIYGFSFAFLALIRITNAALICVAVFTVLICLVYTGHKDVKLCAKHIALNALSFILGLTAAALPIFILFYNWGILDLMIDQVFVYGFQYAVGGDHSSNDPLLLTMVMPLLTIFLLEHPREKWVCIFSALSFLVYLFIFSLGNLYEHYFSLLMPYTLLASIFIARSWINRSFAAWRRYIASGLAALCVAVNLFGTAQSAWRGLECILEIDNLDECISAKKVGDMIPAEDRDSVFGYLISYRFFEINDMYCISKYCAWLEDILNVRPNIAEELRSELLSERPRWIVVSTGHLTNFPFLTELLESSYDLRFSDKYHQLYQLL